MNATRPPSAPVLEIENLAKRYDETQALGGVGLRVEAGETFGLLGANGAGKSTLLKCVLGLVHPDAGVVRVCGEETRRDPLAARRRIGYLPEELRLYDRLTGWEFLELVCGLKDLDCGAAVEESFRYFGLWERRDEPIGGYSLGMRKKVGAIAALAGEPPLLLLDEPLNGLDAESMRRMRMRLEAAAEHGAAIVISSHVMGFVERVCGRVCVLRRGLKVAEGAPARLRAEAGMPDEPFDDVFLKLAL